MGAWSKAAGTKSCLPWAASMPASTRCNSANKKGSTEVSFRNWLQQRWYSSKPPPFWLRPFAALFARFAARRRRRQMRKAQKKRPPLPVIVVGNISVGGTGKTPFVIWLVERLREWGYRPGVISRGYGGH